MTGQQLVGFAAVAALLAIVPGPAVLFVVARTLTAGRRGALLSEVGLALGSGVQVVLVAIGLGAILASSEVAFTIVKLLGASYLVLLGLRAVLRRRTHAETATEVDGGRPAPAGAVRQGLVVGLTNPKTTVFLAAVLPQFVIGRGAPIPVQLLVLGVELLLVALVTDLGWMLVAGAIRGWLSRSPRRRRGFEVTGGVCMIGLGGVLALSRRTGG